ncbi:MAG: DNA polymerase Y family protein [Candidatus Sulfotelmatobacter sp.]
MLFACIFVPCFVVQASLRVEPEEKRLAWSNRPVAIVDGPESLPRVVASNERAQLAGIEVGITKAQAAQCPDIILRRRMPKQEQSAQDALIDCAAQFSPKVESTSPGIVSLDIEGSERIFGPPQKLIRTLAHRAARMGLEVNVAAASNRDTAVLAAKGFAGTTVIQKGNEADFLARLPIDVLPLNEAQAEILDAWGIRKCRDLALLPPVPLVERLGQGGLRLQQLARGEGTGMLVPVDPPLRFEESLELEDPVDNLESLAFVLARLLDQIGARLVSRSLATDELILRLQLEINQDRDIRREQQRTEVPDCWVRTLNLPVAMQDTKILLKLLQLDLAQHGPGAAVKGIAIEARSAMRRHRQAGLFAPVAPEPERLEITLARIRGVVGETDDQGRGKIGAAEVLHSHKPDDFRMIPFIPEEDRRGMPEDSTRIPSVNLILSMFRPPLRANVQCHEGKPAYISFAEVSSAIVCAGGPWITSGHWWKNKNEEWRREEWDVAVQLAGGVGLYRIFLDPRQSSWFVEGLYD